MNKTNKINSKHTFTLMAAALVSIIMVQCRTSHSTHRKIHSPRTSSSDTGILAKKKNNTVEKMLKSENDTTTQKIVGRSDTIHLIDSLREKDTTLLTRNTDTIKYKISKNAPDTTITYTAEDSMVVDIPGKTITLYG